MKRIEKTWCGRTNFEAGQFVRSLHPAVCLVSLVCFYRRPPSLLSLSDLGGGHIFGVAGSSQQAIGFLLAVHGHLRVLMDVCFPHQHPPALSMAYPPNLAETQAARSLEEVLPCINGLSNEPAPEKLLHICEVSMSQLRAGRDSMSWIAAM